MTAAPVKARKPILKRHSLREDIAYSGTAPLQVDRDAGVIRGVKLCGLESRNGRRYPIETLQAALPLYENIPCNVNHGDSTAEDRLGCFRNPRLQEDGIYADLHYLKSHAMADKLAEAAERMPHILGFSHNAEGAGQFIEGVWVIEKIEKLNSVDLVADPATTNGLFEGRNMKSLKERFAARQDCPLSVRILKEMDGDPAMDMPMAVPAPDAGDAKQDLLAAIAKMLDGGDIDMAKKVFALLTKGAEPEAPAQEDDTPDDQPADDKKDDDKKDSSESLRKENAALKAQLSVAQLCESLHFVPSPIEREALLAMTDETKRGQLAESMQSKTLGARFDRRPRSGPATTTAATVPTPEEAAKNGRYRD